jgi:hypothetical protein
MTQKDKSYEYPLSERDVGKNPQLVTMYLTIIELPSGNRLRPSVRKGDWVCPKCDNVNKGSLSLTGVRIHLAGRSYSCNGCGGQRTLTSSEKYMGDWQCQKCDVINYGNITFLLGYR